MPFPRDELLSVAPMTRALALLWSTEEGHHVTSLAVTGFVRRENNVQPHPGSFGGAARSAWEASSVAMARGGNA
eukprot:12517750-Prorocentrum_lima.AAC.1